MPATITLLASASASSLDGNTVTKPAIDSSGATVVILVISSNTIFNPSKISDSKGNAWGSVTSRTGALVCVAIAMSFNYPIVGVGHTFTYNNAGTNPSIAVFAFSGVKVPTGVVTSIVDTPSAGNAGTLVTTIAPGAGTPTQDNEVVVTGVGTQANIAEVFTVDSGFTLSEQKPSSLTACGLGAAYLVQTAKAAVNLNWSWGTNSNVAVVQRGFKSMISQQRNLLSMGMGV